MSVNILSRLTLMRPHSTESAAGRPALYTCWFDACRTERLSWLSIFCVDVRVVFSQFWKSVSSLGSGLFKLTMSLRFFFFSRLHQDIVLPVGVGKNSFDPWKVKANTWSWKSTISLHFHFKSILAAYRGKISSAAVQIFMGHTVCAVHPYYMFLSICV